MDVIIFRIVVLLSFIVFFVPTKARHTVVLCLTGLLASVTSYWAVLAFIQPDVLSLPFMVIAEHPVDLVIDRLSGFFILVINFTFITGILYANGYLRPYRRQKTNAEFNWHYVNLLVLYISMLLVTMFRDAVAFLVAWELMSLSSFFLVIFDSEKKEVLRIGIRYLIQMHIGMIFLMTAFIVAAVQGGSSFGFDGLSAYFQSHVPMGLFVLFFLGFGIKAGFMPLHTWLPHAHPAAPSHVSGMMSGVMIKLGLYGILRVLISIESGLLGIGIFLLTISLITGVTAIIVASVQRDIKKLLAYSSIENIGIIGIGIGAGVIGRAVNMPALAVLGFGGALLHILNHSFFKSLLFYLSGNVYQQTHTRNIEELGGLGKKMPATTLLFLLGSLAICALPPFNGFVSEFLIYAGFFKSLQGADLMTIVFILAGIIGLALIGGLAIFSFTKFVGLTFLGTPRSDHAIHASEVRKNMLIPGYLIALMILLVGLVPALLTRPLADIVFLFTDHTEILTSLTTSMAGISLSAGILVSLVVLLWYLRTRVQRNKPVEENITWGCAYTGADPAVHQYTSASYAESIRKLTPGVVNVKQHYRKPEADELFPEARHFETTSDDVTEEKILEKPVNAMLSGLWKVAVFQTGKIQHYLLYALVFVMLIFLLTLLNWI